MGFCLTPSIIDTDFASTKILCPRRKNNFVFLKRFALKIKFLTQNKLRFSFSLNFVKNDFILTKLYDAHFQNYFFVNHLTFLLKKVDGQIFLNVKLSFDFRICPSPRDFAFGSRGARFDGLPDEDPDGERLLLHHHRRA